MASNNGRTYPMQGQRKASEILRDIERQVANLEFGKSSLETQLDLTANDRDEAIRKKQEYEQMFRLARNTLKKIANSLKHLNANQSSAEQLRDKVKTIRILLEDYDTKVIKKDYEVLSD